MQIKEPVGNNWKHFQNHLKIKKRYLGFEYADIFYSRMNHCLLRLKQRHNILPSFEELYKLLSDFKTGKIKKTLLYRISADKSVNLIDFNNKKILFIYNKNLQCFDTVLPKNPKWEIASLIYGIPSVFKNLNEGRHAIKNECLNYFLIIYYVVKSEYKLFEPNDFANAMRYANNCTFPDVMRYMYLYPKIQVCYLIFRYMKKMNNKRKIWRRIRLKS